MTDSVKSYAQEKIFIQPIDQNYPELEEILEESENLTNNEIMKLNFDFMNIEEYSTKKESFESNNTFLSDSTDLDSCSEVTTKASSKTISFSNTKNKVSEFLNFEDTNLTNDIHVIKSKMVQSYLDNAKRQAQYLDYLKYFNSKTKGYKFNRKSQSCKIISENNGQFDINIISKK